MWVFFSFDDQSFRSVLLAIGRTANIAGLGLETIGVDIVNGKVLVDEREQTSVSHIYALGDVATGKCSLISIACFIIVEIKRHFYSSSSNKK